MQNSFLWDSLIAFDIPFDLAGVSLWGGKADEFLSARKYDILFTNSGKEDV